jgi:hypothetical protein
VLGRCLSSSDWEDHLTLSTTDADSTIRYDYGRRCYITHCGPDGQFVIRPQQSQEQVVEWSDITETSFATAGRYLIRARFHASAGVLSATAMVQVDAPTGDDAVVRQKLQESDLVPYLATDGALVFHSRLERPAAIPLKEQVRRTARICREHGASKYTPYLLSSLIRLAHYEHQGLLKPCRQKVLTPSEAEQVFNFARSYNRQYPNARTLLCMAESLTYHNATPGLKCNDVDEARRLITRAAFLKPDPHVSQMIRWYMAQLAPRETEEGRAMP